MNGWNPREPKHWAALFGLVAVPLFGLKRARNTRGEHSLMLDGPAGSFALTTSGPQSLIRSEQPVVWAWSANVRHSVAIDHGAQAAIVRRWDAPGESETWPVRTEREAKLLVRSFEHLAQPRIEQTVIGRGLITFQDIRRAIAKKGGSELDAILAFNTVLAWVAQDSANDSVVFCEAIDTLRKRDRLLRFSEHDVSKRLLDYPIGHLVRLLREGNPGQPQYLLDADLLIRHASGPLYQEAHRQLLSPPVADAQAELFPNDLLLAGKERARGPAPSYVHYTPPALARALIEIALSAVEIGQSEREICILDPACGSGVFLIEASRELISRRVRSAVLRGFDKSELAVAMSEFCVLHAGSESASIRIEQSDSLNSQWGSPHVVAMNPPFVKWEDLDSRERELVKNSLGRFYRGRPDMGLAFFCRALESIPLGGVVASLVPPSLFESETAEPLRSFLLQRDDFQLRLIGRFQDNGYFDASVEPSFIVVARSNDKRPIRIVTAKPGFADKAIRALRVLPWTRSHASGGYEIYNIAQEELTAARWTPQPQRNILFVRAIKKNTATTVADFFIPRLGVRPGNKSVFMVAEDEMADIAPTKSQRRYFRPVADRIDNGQIKPAGYIFYPYSDSGQLLLSSESEVKAEVPAFYRSRLRPQMEALKNRVRYREWWEPTRPVTTWLAERIPRIVSQQFGRAHNFGFDDTGDFAVVQGVGWEWRQSRPDKSLLLAYLGLLNSRVFDRLISHFCQEKRGGQCELTQHFIERVPLPELADSDLLPALSKIGAAVWEGSPVDRENQDALVMRAYGMSEGGAPLSSPQLDDKNSKRRFQVLSKQWVDATGFYSRVDRKINHPLYREIVAIGPSVIPLMLRDMRDDPSYWSDALTELTGADPVPESSETLEEIASAWVNWGRQHGYDV